MRTLDHDLRMTFSIIMFRYSLVITLLSLPLQPGPIHCPFYANSPPWTPTVTHFSWAVSFGGTPFHLKFCQLPAELLLGVCCIILYVLISLVCIYLFPCVVLFFVIYCDSYCVLYCLVFFVGGIHIGILLSVFHLTFWLN